MFGKKKPIKITATESCVIEFAKSLEHCAINFKESLHSFPNKWIDLLVKDDSRQKYFTFHEKLCVYEDNNVFHSLDAAEMFYDSSYSKALREHLKFRYAIKINMSLYQLRDLLDSGYIERDGKKSINPTKAENIIKIISETCDEVYIDVQDKQTERWIRVVSKPAHKFDERACCTIS